MKSNLQEKMHNYTPNCITGENIITLVGMSGCGKTSLSQKLAMENFFHYSIDYEIAHTHLREKIRQSVIEKIKTQSIFFKELYEKFAIKLDLSLTFDDLEVIATFVIPMNENGKIPLGIFLEHQELYKKAELLATMEFFPKAKIAFKNYGILGFINDTTGSICEIVLENDELIDILKNRTKVVYLQTDESHKQMLISRSREKVKPILYNRKFLMENLREYYNSESFLPEFEIEKEFFLWLFPRLVDFRQKNYEELIQRTNGIKIDVSILNKVNNANDLMNLIYAKS